MARPKRQLKRRIGDYYVVCVGVGLYEVRRSDGRDIATFRTKQQAIQCATGKTKRRSAVVAASKEAKATGKPVVLRRRGARALTITFVNPETLKTQAA